MDKDILDGAKNIFNIEIDALLKTRDCLDDTFSTILSLISSCKGKIITTGIGKPGHVARKLAATFSSLGTSSFYLHPADAMHGDLGMVSEGDVVIAISYSGESSEIVSILPNIKMIGAKIIGITGRKKSSLSRMSDVVQVLPGFQEACFMNLAPTSSTTVELVYGDALAIMASRMRGFGAGDFGRYHPAGVLGKRLITTVDDLMTKGNEIPVTDIDTILMDAIPEMSAKKVGAVIIVDKDGKTVGIITDGDLRRIIQRHIDIYNVDAKSVMTSNPIVITRSMMAIDALQLMKHKAINIVPVVDGDARPIGVITVQTIMKAGIFA